MNKPKTIWTIGHSTHSLETFVAMLRSFEIQLLVDIRRFPASRRYPHFNKDALMESMPQHAIGYVHVERLGGRRKPKPDSHNAAWRLDSFRGYADYMETEEFINAISQLKQLAFEQRVAFMCSEAVWWRCHRSLVSDLFESRRLDGDARYRRWQSKRASLHQAGYSCWQQAFLRRITRTHSFQSTKAFDEKAADVLASVTTFTSPIVCHPARTCLKTQWF